MDPYTGDLFATDSNIEIVELKKLDIVRQTDKLRLFSRLINKHEPMYPNIETWFRKKVLHGIKDGQRKAYLCLRNEEPVATAVVKLGAQSKFCHLHMTPDVREQHLGDLFFSMMALDVRGRANEVHFTVPESLWVEKKGFFQSFGFNEVVKATNQYRNFEEELRCSASFSTVWQKTLEKLPIIIDTLANSQDNIFNGLVMSIKPKWVESIQEGKKIVEIRKKFSEKWQGCRVTIYSSSPVKGLQGHATIADVIKDCPDSIWEKFGSDLGCSKKDFYEYSASSPQIFAITLKDYQAYTSTLFLDQMSHLLDKDLKPPQSHLALENNELWSGAVSIAELLHGRFRLHTSTFLSPKEREARSAEMNFGSGM
ncbi:MAG: hypothetical protein JRD68_01905 [Deltaproteobacteria bacterium]|nr:hypothetical protein [Deltaproteobacteria bacterium]